MQGKSSLPSLRMLDAAHVSEQRLRPYLEEAFGDERRALDLYCWDRRLAAAFFYEISILEVALRNCIDRALCEKYGERWYTISCALFDGRVYGQIIDAWERIPTRFRDYTSENGKIRGRLIAACMFGTWVHMLDAGGRGIVEGPCSRPDHDRVWDRSTLIMAFPGANKIAGGEGYPLERSWVHRQVREVHILRNRIAHHESLINGYPVSGESERRDISDAVQCCSRLAGMIDRNLQDFLAAQSSVHAVLREDPRYGYEQPT